MGGEINFVSPSHGRSIDSSLPASRVLPLLRYAAMDADHASAEDAQPLGEGAALRPVRGHVPAAQQGGDLCVADHSQESEPGVRSDLPVHESPAAGD